MSLPQAKVAFMVLIHVLLGHSVKAQRAGDAGLPRYFQESGSFYLKNYGTHDYPAAPQNWDVIQDQRGNLLFANGDGVLQYDSKKWSLVETPTKSVIRSLKKRGDGRVFVGALDDLGYLDFNERGGMVFVSLLDKLSPDLQAMGNIWTIHINNSYVYFESETGVFVWNDERFVFYPWPKSGSFHKSFFWRGQLYASEPSSGLLVLTNGKFVPAPGGDVFRGLRIYAAMPMNDVLVFGTKFNGLYTYDGRAAAPFHTEADAYLARQEVYTGVSLPNAQLGIGTKFGGVVIIDEAGRVKYMIRKEDGIATNGVRAMYVDQRHNLWLALEEGVSHIEISNPLSIYDERVGLSSAINDMCRFEGSLYVANMDGMFVLEPAQLPDRRAQFRRVVLPEYSTCWKLLPLEDRLLISSNLGVIQLKDGMITMISNQPAYDIHRFLADTSRFIVASDRGLYSMRIRGNKWERATGVDSIVRDNIRFNEITPGKLWIGTYSQGATLVSYVNSNGRVDYDAPVVKHYGADAGLPEGFIKISSVERRASFKVGTESEMLHFNERTERFESDSLFSTRFGFDSLEVFPADDENRNGVLLMKTKRSAPGPKKLFVVTPAGSHYVRDEFSLSRIFDRVGVMNFWDEADSTVWHVGAELMIRQRLRKDVSGNVEFAASIDKIVIGRDSILLDGSGPIVEAASFPYALNSFRFEFTANNFVAEEANVFQYKLEGFDERWSAWSTENVKEYSSLWEGQYRFLVRSKDYAGQISSTQSFAISILPPWYRSTLAFFTYALAFAVSIWLLVRWRSGQLEKDKFLLQAEIERQTTEIRQQNVQLEKQSEVLASNAKQLQELDTAKSNFFVNISHEFRTPLSLIVGPLEKFITDNNNIKLVDLQRMHRSAKRLQQLINQLLELAKLESGTLQVVAQSADLLYFIRVLSASFESLAGMKAIRYEVNIPAGIYEVSFDKDKVETVLYNLLSNAFKFTPENGRIDLTVALLATTEEVVITVRDSGPGIPPAALEHVFDRFYQVDGSSSREFEGSGVGLSLVREIVALLKGSVVVESEPGNGTTFTVRLPMAGARATESVSSDPGGDNGRPQMVTAHLTALADPAVVENPSASTPLILLVEDNKDLRDYLRENLEAEYRVETAENGALGFSKALELIPDLILSDMMMPVMDGFTLCTRVREDERVSHIPFILLTARATIESKLQGLELGADDYMTKPFNLGELRVRIKNLLEQRAILRRSYGRALRIEPRDISITSVDEKFLQRALEVIEANLADQQFSVERFAELMGMSRKNLLRKITAMTDQSVNEFIRNFRLKRAHQLLSGRSGGVSEVAFSVGFNNLSYFSKCFRELYHIAPGELLGRSNPVGPDKTNSSPL